MQIPDGPTIQQVFLTQARQKPGRVIAADLQRGNCTYRDLVTAIVALRPAVTALPGQYVGILLPASVAADTAFLAVLFSGKTPVMINWTAGPAVVQQCLGVVGVERI